MRRSRRFAFVSLLVLAGCKHHAPPPATTNAIGAAYAPAQKDETDSAQDGGTLRLHMDNEPPSLNPLVEHDTWTIWLTLGVLYEPLVREDPATLQFFPSLASRFDAPDERTLRFTLRDGVTFHDGKPFGADDVVATLARLRDPGVSPDVRADFDDLERVEKKSDREVVLHYSRPSPLALQSLAHLPILPAHLFTAQIDPRQAPVSRAPVGTGPFRFVEWVAGQRIVLERAPHYWGHNEGRNEGQPAHLSRIVLRVVRDREAAFELFRRGELDVIGQLTPSQVDRAMADPVLAGARIQPWHLPRYGFIVWNLLRPGLADKRVRQALSMLTDRERYLRVVYRNRAVAVTGPYPLGTPSYDASIPPWPFDPRRARALLDEAGIVDTDGDGVREVGGHPFRIAFLLSAGSPTLEPLVTMMQEEFRKSGVLLDAVPVDWAVMLDRLRRHDFDASSLLWVMQPVQDNYKEFDSSQAAHGQNYGSWKNEGADRLLETLRSTPLGDTREHLDRDFHRLVHEQQPYTFLGNPELDALVAGNVHGFAPGAAGLGLSSIWIAR